MSKDHIFFIVLISFAMVALTSFWLLNKTKNIQISTTKIARNYLPAVVRMDSEKDVQVNIPFTVKFVINTNQQSVNAVGLDVSFDPNLLQVVNIDTSKSFCQFYPENRFNNAQGSISLQCGAPHPGFKGEDIIANIIFMPKSVGRADIIIGPKSMVLVSDGKGTNIFQKPITSNINILNKI